MKQPLPEIIRWLFIVYAIGIILSLPFFLGYRFPFPIPYLWIKTLHIFSNIILFGNMIIGPLWTWYALRSKDKKIIHFSLLTVCWTDVILTTPSFMLVIITGLILSPTWGGYDKTPWILASLSLIGLAIVLAIPTLKYQYRIFTISADTLEHDKEYPEEFKLSLNKSAFWGTLIMIPFMVILFLMVLKPVLS